MFHFVFVGISWITIVVIESKGWCTVQYTSSLPKGRIRTFRPHVFSVRRCEFAPSRGQQGSFLVAVAYDMAELEVRKLRFGWVDSTDLIPQRGGERSAVETVRECSTAHD